MKNETNNFIQKTNIANLFHTQRGKQNSEIEVKSCLTSVCFDN